MILANKKSRLRAHLEYLTIHTEWVLSPIKIIEITQSFPKKLIKFIFNLYFSKKNLHT